MGKKHYEGPRLFRCPVFGEAQRPPLDDEPPQVPFVGTVDMPPPLDGVPETHEDLAEVMGCSPETVRLNVDGKSYEAEFRAPYHRNGHPVMPNADGTFSVHADVCPPGHVEFEIVVGEEPDDGE